MLRHNADREKLRRRRLHLDRDSRHYNKRQPLDDSDTELEFETMDSSGTRKSTLPREYVGEFARLFNTANHSDVTIYIGPHEYQLPAHGLVLAVSSPYFDEALQSSFQEGEHRKFHLKEYSPHALWRVFDYMYRLDYSEESCEKLANDGDDLQLLKHPRVFALADMFCMEDLKSLAVEKFKIQLLIHWISDTFPDCIREVYAHTTSKNDAIRKVIANTAKLNLAKLWETSGFREVVREVGDFAVDLVGSLTVNRSGHIMGVDVP